MVEATTRIIDGHNVRIVPLLGTKAALCFAKVRKALAPALIMAISSVKDMASSMNIGKNKKIEAADLLNSNIDFSVISNAISSVSDNMTPEEEVLFFKEALATTYVNEKSVADEAQFNSVFQGNVLFLYKILWVTLEVNFGDFFEAVGIGNSSHDAETIPTKK